MSWIFCLRYRGKAHIDFYYLKQLLLQYQSTANYTSTLAHKINHSFKANCEWTHALHPCYGKIPAILTLEDLEQGDELFIHYGYDMDEAPQWYADFWSQTI